MKSWLILLACAVGCPAFSAPTELAHATFRRDPLQRGVVSIVETGESTYAFRVTLDPVYARNLTAKDYEVSPMKALNEASPRPIANFPQLAGYLNSRYNRFWWYHVTIDSAYAVVPSFSDKKDWIYRRELVAYGESKDFLARFAEGGRGELGHKLESSVWDFCASLNEALTNVKN